MTYFKQRPKHGEHLISHDLIYNGAIRYWQSGIPMGNGHTAVVAYQENMSCMEFRYGITQAGLYDKRCPIQFDKTHKDIKKLWQEGRLDELEEWHQKENSHYMQNPYPNPRPAGLLILRPQQSKDGTGDLKQVLSLQNGILLQQYAGICIKSMLVKELDCFCIEVKTNAPVEISFSHVIDYLGKGKNWWDGFGSIDEEVSSSYFETDNGFSGEFSLPGGEKYCIGIVFENAKAEINGINANYILKPADENKPVYIYFSVSNNDEATYCSAAAYNKASRAFEKGFAQLRAIHVREWHKFWEVNYLLLEDKFLENLFYLEQYLMFCSLGTKRPFGAMGAWHPGQQPWHGDMHTNINTEMSWMTVFALNRAELSDSFDSHFVKYIEDARKETLRFWELPGLTYPFASLGNLKPVHGGYWRYEIYVSAWVAQVFWYRYRYTGDLKYLKNICHPIQKEILLFYENYLEVNSDGKYYFPMAKPTETQKGLDGSRFTEDVLLDIAALRQLLEAAISAAEILGISDENYEKWKHLLNNLVSLPRDEERKIFVSYRGADPDLPNDHPTLLGAIYPSGLRLNDEEMIYIKNTMEHIFKVSERDMKVFNFKNILPWGDDLSYSWITIAAARIGQRERVYAYLYDLLILMQLKRNGLFTTRPSDIATRDRKVSLINTVGGFLTALTEMFLQSYDGTIRVFPATPEKITAEFSGLKAMGNFAIDGALKDGSLLYIRLTSLSGGTAVIRNDWGEVRITGEKTEAIITKDRIISLETYKDGVYMISPVTIVSEGYQENTLEFPLSIDTEPRSSARKWIGPRYLEQVGADEEWTVTIGA